MSEIDALSAKQNQAIAALMTCKSVRAAADAIGVSERELFRWLRNESFKAELQRAGQEAMDHAIRRLASLTGQAIDTLEEQMRAARTPPGVKVRAADVVLSRLLNLKELADVEARLARLEDIIAAGGLDEGRRWTANGQTRSETDAAGGRSEGGALHEGLSHGCRSGRNG